MYASDILVYIMLHAVIHVFTYSTIASWEWTYLVVSSVIGFNTVTKQSENAEEKTLTPFYGL